MLRSPATTPMVLGPYLRLATLATAKDAIMVPFIIASTVVNTRPRYSSGTCVRSIVRFSTLLQPIAARERVIKNSAFHRLPTLNST